MSRRDFLAFTAAGTFVGGTFVGNHQIYGNEADDDLVGQLKAEIDARMAEFELPDSLSENGQRIITDLRYDGEPTLLNEDPNRIRSLVSTQEPSAETALVRTLEQGRGACHAALRSGRFDEARIAIAQQTPDGKIIFPKDAQGFVAPAASYRHPSQIGVNDHAANQQWQRTLGAMGDDGASLYAGFDRQWSERDGLVLPDESPYHFVSHRPRLFGRRSRYDSCQLQQCHTPQNTGYAYGANCSTGNCNLRPLGTVGGLLRGEFLRPVRGRMRHLPIGQRIVARLFPRVAQKNGWIDCETAHILLVKRLFWAIVIGVSAGTGGGGAGFIFIA